MSQRGVNWRTTFYTPHLKLTQTSCVDCRGSAGSGPSLKISDITLVWDDRKRVKAHKDKLCRGSAGSGPSLETSDVTLVWDDEKRVKAHKDKFCRGSTDSERECLAFTNNKGNPSCEKKQVETLYFAFTIFLNRL